MRPEEFEQRMQKAAEKWRNPRDLLAVIGRVVNESIKRRTPVRTGHLRDSNYARVGTRNQLLIGNTAEYARFVEEGTRYMKGRHFQSQGIDDVYAQVEKEMQRFGVKVWDDVGSGRG